MEQNNLEKSAGFLSEIGIVLRRDGYDTSVPDNGLLPILADGLPLCRISETGSVRYRDADIGSLEREDALHDSWIECLGGDACVGLDKIKNMLLRAYIMIKKENSYACLSILQDPS